MVVYRLYEIICYGTNVCQEVLKVDSQAFHSQLSQQFRCVSDCTVLLHCLCHYFSADRIRNSTWIFKTSQREREDGEIDVYAKRDVSSC